MYIDAIIYYAVYFVIFVILLLYAIIGTRGCISTNDNIELSRYITLNDINTGDIFIVSYQRPTFFPSKALGLINYQHPVIAVWENGFLYIVEAGGYKGFDEILKIPFSKWIRMNRWSTVLHLPLETTLDKEVISQRILFWTNYFSYIRIRGAKHQELKYFFERKFYERPHQGRWVCIDFSMAVLIESGIISKLASKDYYSPYTFLDVPFLMVPGNKYLEPYPINFNNFGLYADINKDTKSIKFVKDKYVSL